VAVPRIKAHVQLWAKAGIVVRHLLPSGPQKMVRNLMLPTAIISSAGFSEGLKIT
jgi:hypothetical protein